MLTLGAMGLMPIIVIIFFLWSIVWKGFALWRAARFGQKGWFIAILIFNTFGILEMIYIFIVTRNYEMDEVEIIEKNQ